MHVYKFCKFYIIDLIINNIKNCHLLLNIDAVVESKVFILSLLLSSYVLSWLYITIKCCYSHKKYVFDPK